jgi:hypothetical protein
MPTWPGITDSDRALLAVDGFVTRSQRSDFLRFGPRFAEVVCAHPENALEYVAAGDI